MFPNNPAIRGADGVANLLASLARAAATGRADRMALQRYDIRRPDGTFEERWWQPLNTPLPGASGKVAHILHTVEDATAAMRERRDAAVALHAEQDRSRDILDSMAEGFILLDHAFRVADINAEGLRIDGRPREAILGRHLLDVWPEAERRSPWPAYQRAIAGRVPVSVEYRRRSGAHDVWLDVRAYPVTEGGGGLAVFYRDVTARKEAEAALRHANEVLEARVAERTAELSQAVDALYATAAARAQVEEALRQSQKMEAVGQLTGGIAHDFNNMLQAIGGSLDMLQRRMAQNRAADADRYAEGARKTVERAAALTQRLLAFARRQTLQPKPVEPDELIGGMAELVRRTVGPGITVDLHLGDGIWSVLCDPSQLENALLNLSINARDAMAQLSSGEGAQKEGARPGGERIAIRTENVCLTATDVAGQEGAGPGEYVEVSVIDAGTGMNEATKARAFEPFFTTKPVGQGTGLGLSQVYGFVRQSGGIVRLDSAPGLGTTVRLYLPRHEIVGGTEQGGPRAATDTPQAAAGEVVLLVEDEADVRTAAAEHLRDMGYQVLEAGDGPAALRLLREVPRVDLLVSDVGLPGGLNGRQVADAARERRPDLPVLFITGYAGTILSRQLAPAMAVIGKPFALDALAIKARAMLEAAPAT